MSMDNLGLCRVSKDFPCPVCGKPDWCLVSKDGLKAYCPRTPSPVLAGALGYEHILHRVIPVEQLLRARLVRQASYADLHWDMALERYPILTEQGQSPWRQIEPDWLGQVWQVRQLHNGWVMPMYLNGRISGAQIRYGNGRKTMMKYSTSGLFLPCTDDLLAVDGRGLYVCEGFSDAVFMARFTGHPVIGRLCCTDYAPAVGYISAICPPEVFIVADKDKPGINGAIELVKRLPKTHPVRILVPVHGKDVREAVIRGKLEFYVWTKREAHDHL